MSTPLQKEDVDELKFTIRVPRHLSLGIVESLEEGITKAIQILMENKSLADLCESANSVARLVVGQVRPSATLLEERIEQMATIQRVFEDCDWLTGEEINSLQKKPPKVKSLPASGWKRRGRVFSVSYNGKDYYARYQFDSLYQPLPIIKDILEAYGEYADAWIVAAWFHFPNGWIAKEGVDGAVPVSPKDALSRRADVINAARNHKGTYVA